ncbi:MAG TPA: TonB-dependent receptor [Pyrinomonadaceae bacterium]|nr:TonB-dependent receptor [Pyrinomonadaceae bacterium]
MNHCRRFSLAIARSLPLAVLMLLFALCALPYAAHGQTATATLSGTVVDQNDAVVPGVEVVVMNPATSLERTAKTGDGGGFTIQLLPPGTYTLTAKRDGFAPVRVENVVLNVGDQKALKVQLKAGSISEMVQIAGDAALLNTSPAVATTINRTFVGNLPLNGRSFSSLVLLTPGVTVATTSSTESGQFSVNGQRASTNYFTIDGTGANIGTSTGSTGTAKSLQLSGAYPGTDISGGTSNLVSIDALEEFKIQTSTYTAESGRQPGGQVQIVTRSGENEFHGLLFEYFRNEALDARNYFNQEPAPQTPLRQNQYGGTFSGPVFFPRFGEGGPFLYNGRDRTFFFFSYEAQRLRLPASGFQEVPSVRVRNSAFPALRPLLNAFPIPTEPETTTTTVCTPSPSDPTCAPNGRRYSGFARFNYSDGFPNNLDSTGIRIDHAVNSKMTLFGRFNESPSDSVSGVTLRARSLAHTRTLTLGGTMVFNKTLINEVRFNFSRQQAKNERPQATLGGAVPIDPAILTNGLPGLGIVTFVLSGPSSSLSGGTSGNSYQRQINFVDNFSTVWGAHSLKFGIDFRRLSPIYGAQDSQGVRFNNESAILNGIVGSLVLTTAQPSQPQFDNYSFYAQDTWKASRRLTIDLGLRWDVNPPPTEAEGRMPPIALGVIGTDVTNATLAPAGTSFYKTFWTAFAPRIGAAYQLRTKQGSETVLRGGFGVYYDLGSGTASGGWPIVASRTLPNAIFPSCPAPIIFPISSACAMRPGIVSTTLPTTTTVASPNENLKLPYSLHWNLAVEQSLGTAQSISVAYVASSGRELLSTLALNRGHTDSMTGAIISRPNPNFGIIFQSFNGPTSDYNSLQVQYRSRLKQRLQTLINYTWSHAIDEASTDISPLLIGVLERGNANFDVRHNFSAALNYDLPMLNVGQVPGSILRGWTVSAIVHAQSGQPVNISAGNFDDENGVAFGLRPDRVLGVPLYINDSTVPGGGRFNSAAFRSPAVCLPLGSPACVNRIVRQGTFGRNVLRGLPLYQLDLALARTLRFTEKLGLQLKGEAFNVFNHPMFAAFGTASTVPSTFGVPTTTLNSGLGGRSSLYQIGGPRSIQLSVRLSF